jgi:hypothetical protein
MPMSEYDRRFAEVFAELNAARLIVNEAFSMALSLHDDPAATVITTRNPIKETIETMTTNAEANPEFRRFVGSVRKSISEQLDAVERWVFQLKRGQATH